MLRGRKRVVLIDPAFPYECRRPPSNPNACWTEVDILTKPPPHAQELILGPGEAVVIPNMHWHAVENLEPTLAVGINEFDSAQELHWRGYGRAGTVAAGAAANGQVDEEEGDDDADEEGEASEAATPPSGIAFGGGGSVDDSHPQALRPQAVAQPPRAHAAGANPNA